MHFVAPYTLSLSLCFAACATSSTESGSRATAVPARAPVEAQPELTALPFAWPIGASAIVTEDALKKGVQATITYRIDVGPRDGGGMTIRYRDLKFLALEGFDLSDPKSSAVIETLERQAFAAMPGFLVRADGTFDGVTNYEEVLEFTVGLMPESERADMRRRMLDPAARAMVSQAVGKIWNKWAGVWVGQEVAEGYVVDIDMQVEANGKTYVFPASIEHKGQAPDLAGHVQLAFTAKLEGEAGTELMREQMTGFMSTAAENAESNAEMQKLLREVSLTNVTTIEATVDASTLLPAHCKSEETAVTIIKGQRHEQVERHSYQFVWTLPVRE